MLRLFRVRRFLAVLGMTTFGSRAGLAVSIRRRVFGCFRNRLDFRVNFGCVRSERRSDARFDLNTIPNLE